MTLQKGFVFNPNRCLGCRACQMACAVNHGLPPGVFLRRIEDIELTRGNQVLKYYLSSSCNHCTNPECFRVCPQLAFRKRRDGIVVQDPGKCTGCGNCTRSCPFRAPVINPVSGKTVKCDLCFGRIEDNEKPFCIAACPVNALQLINYRTADETNSELVKELPGVPRIQLTRPATRYVALKTGKQVGLKYSHKEG